jgi:exodeoxyribonuclease VII large subunit
MNIQGQHIRLSELNGKINEAIHAAFNALTFWVIADVTNHNFKQQSNYHHFELVEKDPDSNDLLARIAGKAWGTGSQKIAQFEATTGQRFTNNINVLVNVSVEYHRVYGLRVNLNDIDPNFTIGLLEQQKRATLERLVANNSDFIQKVGDHYLTRNNRLPLPRVIQHIALISSKTSAGSEDFKHTLLNNDFDFKFSIDEYYTAVQGDANADQLLASLIAVFQSQKAYDAIVITRGGGAQSDFLIFDNYSVARAVAKFPIPIITGIGHQKNETVVDLMAHTSTKTPTKSAEFIIAHNKSFEESLLAMQKNIVIKTQQLFSVYFRALTNTNSIIVNQSRHLMSNHKDDLVRINQVTINTSRRILGKRQQDLISTTSMLLSKPKVILYNRIKDIDTTIHNLKVFQSLYLKNQKGYIGHYVSLIRTMSPENILKKGFAIVVAHNKIVGNGDEISVGDDIDIILSATRLTTEVKQKTKNHGEGFNL